MNGKHPLEQTSLISIHSRRNPKWAGVASSFYDSKVFVPSQIVLTPGTKKKRMFPVQVQSANVLFTKVTLNRPQKELTQTHRTQNTPFSEAFTVAEELARVNVIESLVLQAFSQAVVSAPRSRVRAPLARLARPVARFVVLATVAVNTQDLKPLERTMLNRRKGVWVWPNASKTQLVDYWSFGIAWHCYVVDQLLICLSSLSPAASSPKVAQSLTSRSARSVWVHWLRAPMVHWSVNSFPQASPGGKSSGRRCEVGGLLPLLGLVQGCFYDALLEKTS